MKIIKIGGSVLTYKKTSHKIRYTDLKRIAREIGKALKENPQDLIMVHGAGGATHALAKKYSLQNGAITRERVHGAIETHFSVARLQHAFTNELLKAGLNIIPLYTGSYFQYDTKGKVVLKNVDQLRSILKSGVIPVLNGDMVPDIKKRFSILSGDLIAMTLGKTLGCQNIIFATDVDGLILNRKLIENISSPEIKQVLKRLSTEKSQDTTGELPGKLKAISEKNKETEVLIVNGLKKGNVYSALASGKVKGTKIK